MKPFAITVAVPLPTISGYPATRVTAGTGYTFKPTARNATSYLIVNPPSWASFDESTGVLTGTPATSDAKSYSQITIKAVNGTGTATLPAFSITVTLPVTTLAPASAGPSAAGKGEGSTDAATS